MGKEGRGNRERGRKALTRSDDDDGTEETDFMVGQTERIESFGKVEHGVEQEAGVRCRVKSIPSKDETVQADHRTAGRIEHARQTDEQHFKDAGLERIGLVMAEQTPME